MSLRALGRQFSAQLANRNRWYPNAPGAQGKLFMPNEVQSIKYRPTPDVIEAGRRREAGQSNPDAPWRTPFLQHHFLKQPEPVQREML